MKRTFCSLAAAVVLAGTAASAGTVPASGKLGFDVVREGETIGSYRFAFTTEGPTVTVKTKTDVAVKVPLIGVKLYGFEQESTEVWTDGVLTRLVSKTDDDGKQSAIDVPGSQLIPASLWDSDIVAAAQALNTIDGHTMAISVQKIGDETVPTRSGQVKATHYRITGELTRDVWYDAEGNLTHVEFAGDDGSAITYIRQ